VIESFGNFVIGGNYAVGLVVFSILVIINFVVVTKGAGRVSEVSARFMLDAMPGKQMAIDADLNSGLIDQDEAARRRNEVGLEADFYGSMDGASKFVRGDAIAGLLILFINILGGFAIGMGSYDLSFQDAVKNYTLLAIGDGLVAQIPSLLLSTATAIIVTRVSSPVDMGKLINLQMFKDQRAVIATAVIIGTLGLVPGMPNIVFLILAAGLGFYAWANRSVSVTESEEETATAEAAATAKPAELSWDDMQETDVLGLEVGYRLIPLVDTRQGGKLTDRVRGVRRKASEELGFLVQPVHIRDNLQLGANKYRIILHGVPEAEGDLHPGRELAISAGEAVTGLDGIAGKDPAYGLDALWIEPSQRDYALSLGFTVVDNDTVIATHLSKVLHDNASTLLGHEEVQKLLDNLARLSPRLVEDLVPKVLPLPTVVRVLQNLLHEGIPIGDMRTIVETLAEHAPVITDPEGLTAQVRVALRRLITRQISGFEEELSVITLDAELEQLWLQSMQSSEDARVSMEPGLAERFYQSLSATAEQLEGREQPPVLLVNPRLRPWLAGLVRHAVPALKVLSYSEIAENKQLKVIANIGNHTTATAPAAA
jgi:flagellar biosynthesis protein FlhA